VTSWLQPSAAAPGTRDGGGRGLRTVLGALAGLLAAAVALGFAELTAALVGPASSPVIAVGDTVITLTPEPVKEFAIRSFGENDKVVLVAGTSSPSTPCSSGWSRCGAGPWASSGSRCSAPWARWPPSPGPPAACWTCCRRSSARAPGSSRCARCSCR
jgi:hypothetical protein